MGLITGARHRRNPAAGGLEPIGFKLGRAGGVMTFLFLLAVACLPARAQTVPQIRFSTHQQTGEFALQSPARHATLFRGQMGAKVNGKWVYADRYPQHLIAGSAFHDRLGTGREILIHNRGLAGEPELVEILRTYDHRPYATVQAEVVNHGAQTVMVSDLRSLMATGKPPIDLGAAAADDRVLSDSYSESEPAIHIDNLGQAPGGVHLAVGSQLIYNRRSHYGIFWGALTTTRFLTVFHLRASVPAAGTAARILSFEADSTGTTVIQNHLALRGDPPQDHITLRLPVKPGESLPAERILVGAGGSFLKLLENYGQAVRIWHDVHLTMPAPKGWWSWGAYRNGLNSGAALTNAAWMAQHLRRLGFDYFHMDDGYQFDRGTYTIPDATLFPHGVGYVGQRVTRMGLYFGLWTAPFEVARYSWVYKHHPDWLVHDAQGQPIVVQRSLYNWHKDHIYALDATNPGAQKYLWQTYRVLAHHWNVRYIKLDFMARSAIEGDYYRPHTTAMEAQRIGLKLIRRAVGPDVFLDKDGSTMLNPVGLVDGGRISQDTGRGFDVSRQAAPGIAARFYMNRNFYISDPDSFSIADKTIPYIHRKQLHHHKFAALTLGEARVAITLAAVAGGMYEVGDDLPALGREPHRLELLLNPDLLDMVRTGRPALALDLMTFRPQDRQPSVFLLHEDARQSVLAVFNWTQAPLTHPISLQRLGLQPGTEAEDVFDHDHPVALHAGVLKLLVPPRDVRVIKFVDPKSPPAAPVVHLQGPTELTMGHAGYFEATASPAGAPVMRWQWDFGDGVTARGAAVHHAYTQDGVFTVTLRARGLDGPSAVRHLKVHASGVFDLRVRVKNARPWYPPKPPWAKGAGGASSGQANSK